MCISCIIEYIITVRRRKPFITKLTVALLVYHYILFSMSSIENIYQHLLFLFPNKSGFALSSSSWSALEFKDH